jgi:hypothetical protein
MTNEIVLEINAAKLMEIVLKINVASVAHVYVGYRGNIDLQYTLHVWQKIVVIFFWIN